MKVLDGIQRAFINFTLQESIIKFQIFYRCVVVHRFKYGKAEDLNMKYLMFLLVARRGLKQSKMQGYGLHSKNESNT